MAKKMVTCSTKLGDKNGHFWVLYRIYTFVFLTPFKIFVPCLEILFFINHYFLVCIFKYRTSLRESDWYFYFYSWVINLVVLFILTKLSAVAATATQIEQQQQNKQKLGAFDPLIASLHQVQPP